VRFNSVIVFAPLLFVTYLLVVVRLFFYSHASLFVHPNKEERTTLGKTFRHKKRQTNPFSGFSVLAPESYTRLARIPTMPISRLSPLVAVVLQHSPELRLIRVLLPERFITLCYLLLR